MGRQAVELNYFYDCFFYPFVRGLFPLSEVFTLFCLLQYLFISKLQRIIRFAKARIAISNI